MNRRDELEILIKGLVEKIKKESNNIETEIFHKLIEGTQSLIDMSNDLERLYNEYEQL